MGIYPLKCDDDRLKAAISDEPRFVAMRGLARKGIDCPINRRRLLIHWHNRRIQQGNRIRH